MSMRLTLYSTILLFFCHLAPYLSPAALEDATLRDHDFVIPLIAVGDVIVESFAVSPGGIDAAKKIRTFPNDPTFSVVSLREIEPPLRNEETRFTPATLYAVLVAAGTPSVPSELRCSRLIRFDSQFDAATLSHATVLYAAIVTSSRLSVKKSPRMIAKRNPRCDSFVISRIHPPNSCHHRCHGNILIKHVRSELNNYILLLMNLDSLQFLTST